MPDLVISYAERGDLPALVAQLWQSARRRFLDFFTERSGNVMRR
jgi:hypothetical protein